MTDLETRLDSDMPSASETGVSVGMPAPLDLARSPGQGYQELLDTDTHPVPAILREGSVSSAAAASSTEPPGTILSATRAISSSMRLSSSQPQA